MHPLFTWAQKADLRGVVTNNEGEPLLMANILISPDGAITTTDEYGKFALHTAWGHKEIIISYSLEFLLRKESGRLTGWISYTLSW